VNSTGTEKVDQNIDYWHQITGIHTWILDGRDTSMVCRQIPDTREILEILGTIHVIPDMNDIRTDYYRIVATVTHCEILIVTLT